MARFFKTRSLAAKLVSGGGVRLNGARVSKTSTAIKQGDTLTLTADDDGRGIFVLRQSGAQMVYFDFASFSAALASALDGSTSLISVRTDVMVTDATTYAARRVVIAVN